MHGETTLRPVWHTFRVDASFDKQRGITGIGLTLRATSKPGRDGAVVARFSEAYTGLPAQAGEQFAVLRALEIASESGYRLLRVRSDYNQMRTALKHDYAAGDKFNASPPFAPRKTKTALRKGWGTLGMMR